MKFLKRDKQREDLHELDLPPVPPVEDFEEHQGLIPGLEDTKIKADDMADFSMPKAQDFDFSKEMNLDLGGDFGKDEKMPEFPEFDDVEKENVAQTPVPILPAPLAAPLQKATPVELPELAEVQENVPEVSEPETADYQKFTRRHLFPERRPAAKLMFVRVDKFKAVLDSISMIRGNLRKSEEALARLEHMKAAKDRSYDKFKISLDDLQKKLIFIDKTVFKGE